MRGWSHRSVLTPSVDISGCDSVKSGGPTSISKHNPQQFHSWHRTENLVWSGHEIERWVCAHDYLRKSWQFSSTLMAGICKASRQAGRRGIRLLVFRITLEKNWNEVQLRMKWISWSDYWNHFSPLAIRGRWRENQRETVGLNFERLICAQILRNVSSFFGLVNARIWAVGYQIWTFQRKKLLGRTGSESVLHEIGGGAQWEHHQGIDAS